MATVFLHPFVWDASACDMVAVTVHDKVKIERILAAISGYLEVDASSLALYGKNFGHYVKFHPKEDPISEMAVKGVDSLHAIPYGLDIRPGRRLFELEEGLEIQQALIHIYEDDVFAIRKHAVQQECLKKWSSGVVNAKDYNDLIRPVVSAAQEKILPKYGFSTDVTGILEMQQCFAAVDSSPEIVENASLISKLTGHDLSWARTAL